MPKDSETPKLPLSKELTRFIKRIDSFSFDETSPKGQPSTSEEEDVFAPGAPTTSTGTVTTVETSSAISATVTNSTAKTTTATTTEAASDKQLRELLEACTELSIVHLRNGREYWRPRFNSTPTAKVTNNNVSENPNKINFKQISNNSNNNKSENQFNSKEIENSVSENSNKISFNIRKNRIIKMDIVHQTIFSVIPLFSGENSPNLLNEISVFLTCCQLAHETLGSDEEKTLFLKLLPTRLRGRALELAQEKVFLTITDFTTFIKENFGDHKSYIILNNELRMVQQLPGESLTLYLSRVKRLLEMCKQKAKEQYPNAGSALIEELDELATNSYKIGISNRNHKFYLFQDPEKTLEALTPKIRRLEQTEKYIFYPNFATPMINPLPDNVTSAPSAVTSSLLSASINSLHLNQIRSSTNF